MTQRVFAPSLLLLAALSSLSNTGSAEQAAPAVKATPPVVEGYVRGADGVRLFYRKVGRGNEVAVFLHGGPGSNFRGSGDDMEALADRRTLVMYDQRGSGLSELITDPQRLTVAHHVRDLEAVRRHLGSPRITLIGLSWGAGLAAAYAAEHPARVDRLLLLSPLPPARSPFFEQRLAKLNSLRGAAATARRTELQKQIARASDAETVVICRELSDDAFRLYFLHPTPERLAHAARRCDIPPAAIRNRLIVEAATLASLGDWDFRPMLAHIQAPALVMEGDATNVPLDATREWARTMPNARLLLIKDAGHEFFVEQPARFLTAAEQFLGGQVPHDAEVVRKVAGQDWPANGRDLQGTRYLPAAEITRENVNRLQVAWTYRTGELDAHFATSKPASFEATPLVVDGTMYVSTALGRAIALDAATGRELWTFDPQIARGIRYGDFASRGLSTWLDESAAADAACRRRIFVATAQAQLVALDARTGLPCRDFGHRGIVDLKVGLRITPFEPAAYSMTSPPVVVNGVVITGSSIADNSRVAPASGEVRGYDARTGRLQWTWDPIPQLASDPAYKEWRGAVAHRGGGANAWSTLAADPDRDLVFVPTGSAAPDYYGGLRLGDNRYANSIVALRASTGQLVWAFQTVHHDLWDYDNASPPALVTVTHNGARVPAVVQATKTGMLFVLDRTTGRPIFPVEERAVPASDIAGEQASRTQPFTVTPAPLSPHRFTVDDVWGITEADRAACRAAIAPLRNEGIFTPPSVQGTLVMPSNIGGAHWGGVAIDPVRAVAVVPVNRIAAMVQLIPREGFDRAKARATEQRLGDEYEYNEMRDTPFVMRRRLLLSPSRLPCTPPPFGTLVAVDLQTGARKWEVPLGSMNAVLDAATAAQTRPDWGSPNLGGPIVTAGGVVFIGASLDRRLHAYDIETGRELWHGDLPASAKATPVSYQLASGTQYVAIAVGGGGAWGEGDYVIAFRLRAQ